jgi:hypothetical protein
VLRKKLTINFIKKLIKLYGSVLNHYLLIMILSLEIDSKKYKLYTKTLFMISLFW